MRGPLHVIRRRRAERSATEVDAPQPAPDAPTEAQPAAAVGSAGPPPATTDATPTPDEPVPAGQEPVPTGPSFRERGRMRRRLRYLRRVRELGFRDLGGLVFDQHRFSRVNEELVGGKLAALVAVDAELRALEHALADRRPITELREPGVSACPRCGALHGSDAHFCPSCGLPLRGPRAMAEIGEAVSVSVGEIGAVSPAAPAGPSPQPTQAFAPAEAPPAKARPLFMTGREREAPEPSAPEPPASEDEASGPGREPAPGPGQEAAQDEAPTDVLRPADDPSAANGAPGDPLARRSGERSEP